MPAKRVALSWSGGKDSAWALHQVKDDPNLILAGVFSSYDKSTKRIPHHGVSIDLIKTQGRAMGVPIDLIPLPKNASNEQYETAIGEYYDRLKRRGIEGIVFGDIHLEDIKEYRRKLAEQHGLEAIFPLWGMNPKDVSMAMVFAGIRAIVCSLDPQKMDRELLGSNFDAQFLNTLREDIDPCGESGEFHTFVINCEFFRFPVNLLQIGKTAGGGMETLELFPIDDDNEGLSSRAPQDRSWEQN